MEIILTIDRFEGDQAILKTESGESIIWPKSKLPQEFYEGTTMVFNIKSRIQAEEDKRKTAKDILNEILATNDS